MEHNEILNPNEGKTVDNIVWPFYRYSALIPKQIGADLFVWLYLSLVILQNQQKRLQKDSYTDDVKKEVELIMLEKFSSVIDGQTFDKIRANAERVFTVSTRLKEETFSFVDTYESLFSDKLDVKYIYQDAITGEVVPFFGDTSHIDDSDSDRRENTLKTRSGIKEPPKASVKRAYEHYMRLKKYSSDDDAAEIQAEFDELFFDEDAQTFIDGDFETFEETVETPEQKSLRDYNVIFLKDSKVLYNVDVSVFVRGNELLLKSPFDRITDQWFNRCAVKAQNVSEDVAELFKELRRQYLIEERRIVEFKETKKSDFASTLKHCAVIYRMIDSLGDDDLRRDVAKLDQSFAAEDKGDYYLVNIPAAFLYKTLTFNIGGTEFDYSLAQYIYNIRSGDDGLDAKIEALNATIANLEAQIEAAGDADTPELDAQLATAQSQLKAAKNTVSLVNAMYQYSVAAFEYKYDYTNITTAE